VENQQNSQRDSRIVRPKRFVSKGTDRHVVSKSESNKRRLNKQQNQDFLLKQAKKQALVSGRHTAANKKQDAQRIQAKQAADVSSQFKRLCSQHYLGKSVKR